MKTCFKCHQTLPLSEFYRHSEMKDGHLNKCKDCTRDDVTEHRIKNVGRIREYDRQRAKWPHAVEQRKRTCAAWAAKYPERRKAQHAVTKAVRAGRLVKPVDCQRCGDRPWRIEAHHHDYSKPLDVEWLCKPCHAQADKERRTAA